MHEQNQKSPAPVDRERDVALYGRYLALIDSEDIDPTRGMSPNDSRRESVDRIRIRALSRLVSSEVEREREALRELSKVIRANHITSGSIGPLMDAGFSMGAECSADMIDKWLGARGSAPEEKGGGDA